MKVIVFNSPLGLGIVVPAEGFRQAGETNAALCERVAKKDLPPGTVYRLVDETEFPEDRTYRDAWQDDGQAITIDQVKAAGIDAAKGAP